MKFHLIPLLLILMSFPGRGQVIINEYNTFINIFSGSRGEITVKKSWTVYSDDDEDYNRIILYYNPSRKITDISLSIKETSHKSFDMSDFTDVSFSPNYEIDDSRTLIFEYTPSQYPCTFKLEYKTQLRGIAYLTDWMPLDRTGVELKHAVLKIRSPENLSIHHREQHIGPPNTSLEGKTYLMEWVIDESVKLPYEPYSPSLRSRLPVVHLSPDQIKFAGTRGSTQSWQNLGEWVTDLGINRGELPENALNYLNRNIIPLKNDEEKIREILTWVRQNTRYVSIQMGLGGYQPAPAEEVYSNAYGDCKGLSNLTVSALRAAGIESYYTLVYSDDEHDRCLPDFPSIIAFNHAIVCVPRDRDTLWLECTSDYIPYNYVHKGIIGKNALLVDGANSKLVKMGNEQSRPLTVTSFADISFDLYMKPTALINSEFREQAFEETLYHCYQETEDQVKTLQSSLNLTAFKIDRCNYTHIPHQSEVNLSAVIELRGSGQQLGNDFFFSPLIFKSRLPDLPENPYRSMDIDIRHDYKITDSIRIAIPDGYKLDYLPENINIASAFGNCEILYIERSGELFVSSETQLRKGVYEASDYSELRNFIIMANAYPDRKIILSKVE